MPSVRQPLHLAVVDGDPPELVAAPDRRGEEQVPAVGRRPQARRLAGRDVTAHPRAGHQVVATREVAPAALPGLASVRREQPDVVAASSGAGVAVAQRGHGLPVRQPGWRAERRAGAVRDPDVVAARDVHDAQVELPVQVRVATALGGVRDARAVRREDGVLVVRASGREPPRSARGDVHDPEIGDAVVDEARPVEHVLEPIEIAVVGGRRLARPGWLDLLAAGAGIRCARGPMRGALDHERPAVGRPGKAGHAPRKVGEPARLAAVEREQVHLRAIFAVLRCVGLFLGDGPPVGQEREGAAVGREPGVGVVAHPERHLARRRAAVGRRKPDRVAVGVPAPRRRLDGERDQLTVGREARIGRDPEPVEVLGLRWTRHGVPRCEWVAPACVRLETIAAIRATRRAC